MREGNSIQSDTKIGRSRSAAISVIIPVYNVAPYIGDCIKSFKAQTFTDLEFIFVDDNSSDNSLEIIEAYAKEDPRVLILRSHERRYAGFSRNRGIETANGEYLSFIDPDDWISDDFYRLLYQSAKSEGADITKGSAVYINKHGSRVKKTINLNQLIMKGLSLNKPLFTIFTREHWTGLYRQELFKNKDVRYGSTRRSQDNLFLLAACTYAKKFAICDDALYFYRQRSGSAVNSLDPAVLADNTKAFDEIINFILSHPEINEYAGEYIQRKAERMIKIAYSFNKHFRNKSDRTFAADRLTETLRRFPGIDDIRENSLPVQALMEYQICLPKSIYKLPWDSVDMAAYLKLFIDWMRFLSAHPQFTGDFIKMMTDSFRKLPKRVITRWT